MAAHASWSGSFHFGLITIPMKIYKMIGSAPGSGFRQLNTATNNTISRQAVDSVTGEPVEQIGKGFPVDKHTIVPISDEEILEAMPERSREMTLESFIPTSDLPIDQLDVPYAVKVEKEFAHAYSLVVAAMRAKDVTAICRVVMSTQESLFALLVRGDGLIAYKLHWSNVLRDIQSTPATDVPHQELDLAMQLVVSNMKNDFALDELKNSFTEQIQEIVEAKLRGDEVVKVETTQPRDSQVDLHAALLASLGESDD